MAKKKMFKYRILGGTHRGLDNVTHRAGQEFTTDEGDLCARFPNKFEPVGKFVPDVEEKNDAEEADEEVSESTEAESSKYGENVTELFPHAEVADLLVFKSTDSKGDWYNVTKPDDVNRRLNRKRLKEEKVAPFVKKLSS